ncbi:hypothetical protein INT46_005009 [Mucor plumbeus]|uniref:Uncharacterized protein n=1 Tax=Mucor plumbeus TaxID=97098 RepID=A0A8H7QN94_9FUNG|nr:hypothetical protein INT46_005009 [Mucor plumbeus]
MSLSGAEKLLKGMELKARRKSKTNFVSAANKKLRLLAVNKWSSDSESFYLSDVPGINLPHLVQPRAQGSDDGDMFWSCISGDGPGYGTAIIDGTIDSNDTMANGKQVKDIRF